jgi:hypothetical protein
MSQIKLRSQHLLIEGPLAAAVFGDAPQVHTVYYPQQKSLLLAPMDDEFFAKLHKTALQMLKTRNLHGDKSISLQELLIDHELDDSDRDLAFSHTPGTSLLQVLF